MTRLAAFAPSSSRSRGSPSSARQKMHPASRGPAPMYAMRHGAQRTCMPGRIPAPTPDSVHRLRVVGRPRLAVDAQTELLPDLEERDALGVHGDQGAGLGVASLARLAVLHDEAPETADLDALPAHERL